MPEAPVNEDGPFPTAVRDVGRAGKVAIVNAKAAAERVEELADRQLGRRAVLPDPAESCGGLGIHDEITMR